MIQIKRMESAINRRLDGFKELKAEVDIINREREMEKCAIEEEEREQGGQVAGEVESIREAAVNQIEAHLAFVYGTEDGDGEEEEELVAEPDGDLSDMRSYKTDSTWGIKVKGKNPHIHFLLLSFIHQIIFVLDRFEDGANQNFMCQAEINF